MQDHKASPTADRARGRWYEILNYFGTPSQALRDKHGPCPACGGRDRYRWDDLEGKGTYFCNGCGAGNGFSLLMKFKGCNFKAAAHEVDIFLNNGSLNMTVKTAQKEPDKDPRIALLKVFNSAKKPKDGGEVHRYLNLSGLSVPVGDLDCIMEHKNLYYESGQSFPAMLALVKSHDGRDVSIQRIYIQGGKQAPVDSPKKTMTPIGTINGASVRLFPIAEHIGIGEGVLTCIAAHELFNLPVWSVLSTNGMKTFIPPKGIIEITLFADNDKNFAGQAAAYSGAYNLFRDGFKVNVLVPEVQDTDWLDVLRLKNNRPAKQYDLTGVK